MFITRPDNVIGALGLQSVDAVEAYLELFKTNGHHRSTLCLALLAIAATQDHQTAVLAGLIEELVDSHE